MREDTHQAHSERSEHGPPGGRQDGLQRFPRLHCSPPSTRAVAVSCCPRPRFHCQSSGDMPKDGRVSMPRRRTDGDLHLHSSGHAVYDASCGRRNENALLRVINVGFDDEEAMTPNMHDVLRHSIIIIIVIIISSIIPTSAFSIFISSMSRRPPNPQPKLCGDEAWNLRTKV